jgi:hypothetical protein
MTETEILDEVRSAPLNLAPLELGFEIIQRPGWYQTVSEKFPVASANEVVHSELADGEVENKIDRTMEQYAAIKAPFKWCVTPWTKPTHMAELLKAKGFGEWSCRGMYLRLDQMNSSVSNGVTVERLSEPNLEEFIDTSFAGWNKKLPTAEQRVRLRGILKYNLEKRRDEVFDFLARLDGVPVGTGGFILKQRCAYFVAANVLNEYRGRGIYRSLLSARASAVRDLGLNLVVTHARENTSAPILEKLGFQTAYKYRIFQFGGVLPE